jgi:hypothetical protein
MILLVITGGQTGADQAGWRAAKAVGIKTGGWMPKGFQTEDGRHPEFAEMYGAKEHSSVLYPTRTRANVFTSDALVWFGNCYSSGGRCTLQACHDANIDYYVVHRENYRGGDGTPSLGDWINEWCFCPEVKTLMVAGNRESSAPGIGAWVERYLTEVFRILGEKR